MEKKEKVYDDKIAPLMSQIIEICKEEGMPMFADFQIGNKDFCTTYIYPENVGGRNVVIQLYNMLSKCKNVGGINFDQFVLSVGKQYGNDSSIALKLMGFEPK